MQVNDALFPIGGYTHSYGLETYIQKGKVSNNEQAEAYIRQNLKTNFLYTELLAVSLAYDYASHNDLEGLIELDEILTASKVALELRAASHKLGVRFMKMVEALDLSEIAPIFKAYQKESEKVHHAVVYGCFVGALGVEKSVALSFFIYSATSTMVTNCVKTIPLSQTAGQQILFRMHPLLEKLVEQCLELTIEDLGRSTPALDVAAMQHEVLYSRLYMS
ncbi:MAG: urease accessory protein UreF [Cellulosilyticum sp.]|nr:urease accessory protein UreF [Cellulosilyticum sp.]